MGTVHFLTRPAEPRRQVLRVVKEAPAADAAMIAKHGKACARELEGAVRICCALLGAGAVAKLLREMADGLDIIAEREARYS